MRKGTCSGNEVSATTALSAPQHGPQHYWLLFLNSISQAWHVSFAYRCRTEASPSSHSLLSSAYGWKQAFSLPPRTKKETNSSLYIYSTYCWVGPRFPRCPPSAKRCCPHSSVPERTTRRQPGGDTPRLPFRSRPGAAPHAGAPLFPPLRQLPALTALPANPSRDSSAPASHPRERPQLSAVAAVPPGPKGGSHAAQPPPACHDTDRCNSPAGPAAWHSPGLFLSPPPPVRRPQPSEPRGRRASRLLTKTRDAPPPPAPHGDDQAEPARRQPQRLPQPPGHRHPFVCRPARAPLASPPWGRAGSPRWAPWPVARRWARGRQSRASSPSSAAGGGETPPAHPPSPPPQPTKASTPSASANQWENGRRPRSRESWKARPQPTEARAGRGGGVGVSPGFAASLGGGFSWLCSRSLLLSPVLALWQCTISTGNRRAEPAPSSPCARRPRSHLCPLGREWKISCVRKPPSFLSQLCSLWGRVFIALPSLTAHARK